MTRFGGHEAPQAAGGGRPRRDHATRAGRSCTSSTRCRSASSTTDGSASTPNPGPPRSATSSRHWRAPWRRSSRSTSAPRPNASGRRSPTPRSGPSTTSACRSCPTGRPAPASTLGSPNAPGPLGEGEVLEVDPPRRLVHTLVALWSDDVKSRGHVAGHLGDRAGRRLVPAAADPRPAARRRQRADLRRLAADPVGPQDLARDRRGADHPRLAHVQLIRRGRDQSNSVGGGSGSGSQPAGRRRGTPVQGMWSMNTQRPPVDRGRAHPLQRRLVPGARVALVELEVVAREVLGLGPHDPVAGDLGQDRRGRDRQAGGVALDDASGVARRRRSPSCRRSAPGRARRRGRRWPGGRPASAPPTCRARRTRPGWRGRPPRRRTTSAMRSNSASRSRSVSIFESRILLTRRSARHAPRRPTLSGPAHEPRPTSSTPTTMLVALGPQLALDREARRLRLERLAQLRRRGRRGHGRRPYRRRPATAGRYAAAGARPRRACRLPGAGDGQLLRSAHARTRSAPGPPARPGRRSRSRRSDATPIRFASHGRRRARRTRGGRGASLLSAGSFASVLSAGSALSAMSFLSFGSVGSILSIGSSGSILSIGSSGSVLSIGAVGRLPPDRSPAGRTGGRDLAPCVEPAGRLGRGRCATGSPRWPTSSRLRLIDPA